MIMRIWLIVGIALAALAWVLTVPLTPQPMQRSESTPAPDYRAAGLLPPAGELNMSTQIGHDVFEVPAEDARHVNDPGGMAMPGMEMGGAGGGMNMPGMDMGSGTSGGKGVSSMPGMAMDKDSDGGGMAMSGTPAESGGGSAESMPGMATGGGSTAGMKAKPPAAMEGGGGAMSGMGEMEDQGGMAEMAPGAMPNSGDASSTAPMTMPEGAAAHGDAMPAMEAGHGEEEEEGGFGLEIVHGKGPVDRTVNLDMREWGFQPANLTVRTGEVIRFVVHNVGNVPHEFMFMPPQGMNAVRYRMERADWNLKEHKALFEREALLPGDSFEVTVRIQQPGMWMYMCMFPYHMRFGMMGMMMTKGMSMGGGDMKM